MKLTAQFKALENKLFDLEDKEILVDSSKKASLENPSVAQGDLVFVEMPWEKVGMDEDSYNEEFLAAMRDWLKSMEGTAHAVIVPVASNCPESDSEKESFVASMKHSARRIKDCTSVVGYAIPSCVDSQFFMEELKAKHGHYIFFSSDSEVLKDPSVVKF